MSVARGTAPRIWFHDDDAAADAAVDDDDVLVIGWGERFIVCCYGLSFSGWRLLHLIDIRFIHFGIITRTTDCRQTFGTQFSTKLT